MEGGMFVKLVVVDDRDYDGTPWTICCGAHVTDTYSEPLVGDDRADRPTAAPYPADATPEQLRTIMDADDRADAKWVARHFPAYGEAGAAERHASRPYLASMVLGITGWSGASAEYKSWRCTYEDLTEDGKAIYRQLQALYEGCTLHLLTFLDT